MRCTFILKDFSPTFYEGTASGSIVGLLSLSDDQKWEKLRSMAAERRISMKIGNGQFRDQVELNQMLRRPCTFSFSLEPRRGYRLATIEVAPIA